MVFPALAGAGATLANHHGPAGATKQLCGQQIIVLGLVAGRGFSVCRKPFLHPVKQVLGDNGGDTAGGDNFPIAVFPDILPVFQQTGHKVQVNLFTSYRCNALLPHFLHDFLHGGSLVIPGEYFQHHGGGARVKLVLHILVYNIAEGGRTAVILAFQSVFRMAPDNLLGQLSGVVFRHTFQHTFQNDTLRPLGNVFRSRKHLDAILPKLGLIMGAVVAVPGETV